MLQYFIAALSQTETHEQIQTPTKSHIKIIEPPYSDRIHANNSALKRDKRKFLQGLF